MLTKEIIEKINELVYTKPRSVDEIAKLINVNWRTANRYVEKISVEEGTISARVFREGTPGSLKVVFWNNIEKLHASEIQERFFKQIEFGKSREQFSPSEIFQFVDKGKKEFKRMTKKQYYSSYNFKSFTDIIKQAERQVLFFSGNLTFINFSYKGKTVKDLIEDLGKKKITSKILTRVEMAGIKNIEEVISINKKIGYDAVELKHCYHPLRATIVDDKVAILKEVLDPKNYASGELKNKVYILYYIYDENWIEWLQKVFWYLFRSSVDAKKRIEELKLFV
jgi:hypothetical protein